MQIEVWFSPSFPQGARQHQKDLCPSAGPVGALLPLTKFSTLILDFGYRTPQYHHDDIKVL